MQSGAFQPTAQSVKASLAKRDRLVPDVKLPEAIRPGQLAELPLRGHFGRQMLGGYGHDEQTKDALVQKPREVELISAPSRGEPSGGDQAQHCLAAVGGCLQRLHPPLAGSETAIWVNVEKDIGVPMLR